MTSRHREPAIAIRGHSGCTVTLHTAGRRPEVEKATDDPGYARRLQKQIERQRQARAACDVPSVRIPEIYAAEATAAGGFAARMEYLRFLDGLEFVAVASRPEVDRVVAILLGYLEGNLRASRLQRLDAATVLAKLDEIAGRLAGSRWAAAHGALLAAVRARIDTGPLPALPIGPCHGDLTFSNILVASDTSAIGLLDFLDSYLESPLVDLAKLRQDTQFGWSLLMADAPADPVRFRQVMAYIDRRLVERFGTEPWFSQGIDLVQAVNLLRIAPYAREDSVHQFIRSAVQSLGFAA